jgi:hypothetical protein
MRSHLDNSKRALDRDREKDACMRLHEIPDNVFCRLNGFFQELIVIDYCEQGPIMRFAAFEE